MLASLHLCRLVLYLQCITIIGPAVVQVLEEPDYFPRDANVRQGVRDHHVGQVSISRP